MVAGLSHAKPFGAQYPEQIAKDYGGNKQKIAQAMQMGVVDPTVGTLAGMFIDRMAAGAMQSQAPQGTIASQVFNPQTPPAQAPGGAGLGALPAAPTGAGAPPPQMPMPPQSPQDMQPMSPGMADGGMVAFDSGGLASLPVPDDMFNSSVGDSDTQHYARGGPLTDDEAWNRIKRLEGGLGPNGEMRVSSAGAVGPAQLMPTTAPEAARLAGLPWDERRYRTDPAYNEALGKAYYLSRVSARGGDYSKAALDYHSGMGNVDKGKIGPAGREYLRKFGGAEIPTRNISTPEGQIASTEDIFGRLQERFAPSADEREVDATRLARAKELSSPEHYEKQRKADMWQTLAEIGFNMASSKSPYLLQAIGEAAAAALPGAKVAKKERDALKDRALEAMQEMNGLKRKENLQLYGLAIDAAKTNMQQQQFGQRMNLDKAQLAQQATLAREGRASAENIARISATSRDTVFDVAYQNNYAKLKAEAAAGTWKTPQGKKPSEDFIRYWAQQHALADINAYKGATGQGAMTAEQIAALQAGRGGGQSGNPAQAPAPPPGFVLD